MCGFIRIGIEMKFSIIIPVYNVEEYLIECLNRVYDQNYDDYEVVLVDDGSTDKSGQICDEFVRIHKNTKVIHKNNQGLISARREGYKNATGDYIVNCDSDDYLELDTLSSLNKVIVEGNPDLIIYNSYLAYENYKEIFFNNIFTEGFIEDKSQVYDKLLLTHQINSLCMKAYKRGIVDYEQNYTEYFKCNYGEDLLQSVPLVLKAEKIFYLNKQLYNYRMKSGMTTKYNNIQYWSNKAVYFRLRELMSGLDIEDFEYKISKYLVSAAYDAIHINKVVGEFHRKDISNIANDKEFEESYNKIRKTKYKRLFTRKQYIILELLHYKCIRIFLKVVSN